MDSDCFPVGPFAQEVKKITAQWERGKDAAALCRGKMGSTWQLASPPGNIAHFSMRPDYPYYNSGVWILHSRKVLDDWAVEIANTPKKGMFEQDTFNYLLFKNNISIQTLDNDIWNVTHDSLNKLKVDSDTEAVFLKGQPVLIIHITGDYTLLKFTAGPLRGGVRTLKDHSIRNIQVRLLKDWAVSLCK